MRVPQIVCVLLLLLSVCLAAAKADELAFGFEEDKDGNNIPDHWKPVKGLDEKSVSIDQSIKKSGKSSIRLDDTSEWGYVVVSRLADVKPGTKYCLKAWAKSEKTTGPTCIYISEYHAPGKGTGLLKLHVLIMEQPRDWKEFEKEFTTTEKTGRIRIELCPLGFGAFHTGTAWFDDIKIEEAK